MEPRVVAALVASLISQTLILFLLLPLPPISFSTPPPLLLSPPNPNPNPLLSLSVLLHLLSSSQIATISLLPRKRKRKRNHNDNEEEEEEGLEEEKDNSVAVVETIPRLLDPTSLSFLMSSSTFDFLSGLLDPLLDCRDPPASPLLLPGPTRLAIALSRLSSGLPYPDIAARFSVPEPHARFCARHLCRVLTTNFRFHLSFPLSSSSLTPLHPHFPNSRAALSCARFGNCVSQIAADADSRILSLAAGFRVGRTSADILKQSSLYRNIASGQVLGAEEFLVGDGRGYPLLPWLMVPFADPAPGSAEEDFNAVHGEMCRPVRRAVVSLNKWGVMGRLAEEEDAKMAAACVGACTILHNVLLMREDYSALATEEVEFVAEEKLEEGEETVAEEKAVAFRSVLAARARAVREAGRS